MRACKDPALTYLNGDGYNVVRTPRVGIEPLDVLGRDKGYIDKLGSLSEIWDSTEPVPKASDPQPTANISGQKTQSLDLGIGLKLLAGVLTGMGSGIGLPSLQSKYKNSRSIEFKFVEVYSVGVTPFALGNYLAHGTLRLSNPVVQAYFDNEKTDEFIITEVLKSNSVGVTARDQTTAEVGLDVPAIQGAVGANVSVKTGANSTAEVIYEGRSLLTFGFKTLRALFANGSWRVKGNKPDVNMAFGASAGDWSQPELVPILINNGGLVRLRPKTVKVRRTKTT
jgi:hypothetical protein